MMIKWIGGCLIFVGCGGFGFTMAAACRREEGQLVQLEKALEFMSCELSCRMTPLPQLCRTAANAGSGPVAQVLTELADGLDQQISPDARGCMAQVLDRHPELPRSVLELWTELGVVLGRFDLPGQLRGLESTIQRTKLALQRHRENRSGRIRSYQTLGLCAGAALAILFL